MWGGLKQSEYKELILKNQYFFEATGGEFLVLRTPEEH